MRDGKANAICVDSVHSVITLSEKASKCFLFFFVFCVFYGSLSPLLLLYIILTLFCPYPLGRKISPERLARVQPPVT